MSFTEFLKDFIDANTNRIKVALTCSVESFDKQSMTASVVPLMKFEDSNGNQIDFPKLVKLPVNTFFGNDYQIIPDYKKGDLVEVIFSAHGKTASKQGQKEVASKDTFDLSNGYIVGSVFKGNLSNDLVMDGIVIAHKDGNYINLNDEKIKIKGDLEVTGEITAKADTAPVKLSTHTHTGNLGAPTSAPMVGS